jgi:hypothetical protein
MPHVQEKTWSEYPEDSAFDMLIRMIDQRAEGMPFARYSYLAALGRSLML